MKRISHTLWSLALAAAALTGSACTVKQTDAPSLTGPSEFALSVSLTAAPDVISQDGRSNSTIAVAARDAGGRALANVPFRLDMLVDGEPADYGALSTRNLVTGSDGRATAVYTAPPGLPSGATGGSCGGGIAASTLAGGCVQIVATSVGSDYSASASHTVQIHLTPTGVIVPSSATPVPAFTLAPASPSANAPTQFDASTSCAGALDSGGRCPGTAGSIQSYAWNFGDGGSASGRTASHTFAREQTYLVTLTVTNDRGLSASTTQSVTMGAGSVPVPTFIFSPTAPAPGQDIFFDATSSKPGIGHNIVRFVWNWGDGSGLADSSSPTNSHKYSAAGSYQVTLTVSDEAGQTATSAPQTISFGSSTAPTAAFIYSPTTVTAGQTITFDATKSNAGAGHTIQKYTWNWNDGSSSTTTSSAVTTHAFPAGGPYKVTLVVTDELGQRGTAEQTVTGP